MLYVVIMAGGKGERFWPLSTPDNPKPFLRFFSDRSLLQQTFDRARKLVPVEQIFLVAGRQHEALCREQLPELPPSQLLMEPTGRDTAAAIGYASLHLPAGAFMLVLPADHLIPDVEQFAADVKSALAHLGEQEALATFGIKPDRPETNYGYVKALPENAGTSDSPVYRVERFVEKPDLKRAEEFVRLPGYYWNSGIFLWKVSLIQSLIARFVPDLWKGLQDLKTRTPDFDAIYSRLPRISIDFGVMEKAPSVVVAPARFRWDDIGTWLSLLRILEVNADRNLVWGRHTGLDTTDCIIYGESHTIATAGVRDLIIVQRGNNTLICSREYANRLKELLSKLPQ
jgi:mannose-1-phosphate guanylyltransferase